MDHKIQGGTASPTGERDKEGGGGKKDEDEEKNRDKEGGTGTAGAGGTGDDQSFSVKESNLSEGNVKLKIGLQAKRIKKPPKNLDNYVCRPAFRATVRHAPRSGGNTKTKSATATGDGAGNQTQSSAQTKDKEREKSPCVNNNKLASSSTTASTKAPTPPPTAPSLASTNTPPPAQVNGNAPAKKVRLYENAAPIKMLHTPIRFYCRC